MAEEPPQSSLLMAADRNLAVRELTALALVGVQGSVNGASHLPGRDRAWLCRAAGGPNCWVGLPTTWAVAVAWWPSGISHPRWLSFPQCADQSAIGPKPGAREALPLTPTQDRQTALRAELSA